MRISILGCGWLGMELAKKLRANNHEVRGSVTKMENMQEVRSAGIIPYSIKLFEKGIQGDIRSFLSGADVLVVDVPPGLRKNPEVSFVNKIKNLIPYIENSYLQKVIFTSSTSVYEDKADFPVYDENSKTDNADDTAIQLRNTELLFLNNEKFNASVIRFGGLLGPERHPVKYLSGRSGIQNPFAPVNLVHQEDCIAAICKLMDRSKDNSVWNVVHPDHPGKEGYYTRIAEERNLPAPEFDHNKPSVGKKISSEKLIRELKFEFSKGI
ncbi:SDR family NAD(P)-dependent oxidoreductase [Christiangramia sabulilitoris]|uniref:SDR family NAD(P)-dependent oxidoreductase n=1 Tax=Christiangramia sabulilitoris TaxID=2583991 RepID=A0A550I8B9_9FLAO|nr:SDR family NAD(P)-dependent oxidoreductase [Christiangramia sabulilitoris]TRO67219.1 SDR family NAD(P)-dependent oxidoreductase [Christiangramia sabulilitoris]